MWRAPRAKLSGECRLTLWALCPHYCYRYRRGSGPANRLYDRHECAAAKGAGAGVRGDMELKQLKYFLCVAELGSFSKAAVQLSVAQPILSRQIRSLEHDLNAELFYRNGRGIVLSEAGKLLETYAREIIGTADRASFEITAMKSAPRGRITIAMPPSIGWVLTVPLVLRCRREFPMIALHVVEGFSGHVTEWLSTGRIDIGVVYNAPRLPALMTEPLLE